MLTVLHIVTGLGEGGAESALYNLCTWDVANTHVVASLTGDGKYGPRLRASGIEVHCLEMPRGRLALCSLVQLWRLQRSKRPDVVQTWMYHADLVGGVTARLAGIRAVCWGLRHGSLRKGALSRRTILVAKTCAWLSWWIPWAIVSCSRSGTRIHQSFGYAANKFVVIPNGYDLARYTPNEAFRLRLRAEWGVQEATPVLGMVARFDPHKDHANLLAALGILRCKDVQFCCVLAGLGMDNDNVWLREEIVNLDLASNVRLLGGRSDVPAVMTALDVHVLSSVSEAFPNVLAEAMACGTPCVTTDVGDAAYIVGDTGWVVSPADSESLAGGICKALDSRNHSGSWQMRRYAARERVSTCFDPDRVVGSYCKLWKQAVSGRPFVADAEDRVI